MVSPDIASVPRLRPELAELPREFVNLFEAVVRLVGENPPSPNDPGHPEHGTRIFLPTPTEARTTSAFIGWEDKPRPFSAVDDDGNILELDNIAHVNIESVWGKTVAGRRVWGSAAY